MQNESWHQQILKEALKGYRLTPRPPGWYTVQEIMAETQLSESGVRGMIERDGWKRSKFLGPTGKRSSYFQPPGLSARSAAGRKRPTKA